MACPLETQLGHRFRNPSLLQLALTHPSWGHERKQPSPHNERLEFLGDAVLELAISDHLYHLFPDMPEGHLTKMRAHLVNRSALTEMAKEVNLGDHLLLGKAEAAHGGRERPSNLANAMEAVIGAIFLDGGYTAARAFAIAQVDPRLKKLSDNPEPENAKGILQERLHAVGLNPVYRITSETGPAHRKQFEAQVEVHGRVVGKGAGLTKKEAETRAAMSALSALRSRESGSVAA
ncbi:MAG: ribonuclease III [Verrucomicrobia bacterium]|nr:ribonuclease III [Verrucomicrobiota bacterium]